MYKRSSIGIMFFLLTSTLLFAQIVPDIGEYKTLKCDFHMHTIFSDGEVWPTIRVDEALDEGLDAIAITDHLEYLPHKKYVSTDKNVSYEIARKKAQNKGLICIAGTEITRWMPPGHLNALFIEDANKLVVDDFLTVIEEAISQGAFILWNHPGWIAHQPDKVVRWYDIHQELVDRGWLHGIEFANTHEYYKASMGLAKEHDLALFANSDVHGLVYREFLQKNTHRPLTLVFAEKKSEDAIKDALFSKRSIALSEDNVLAGHEDLLKQFVQACLTLDGLKVINTSEIPYVFDNKDLGTYFLPALGELTLPTSAEWEIKNTYIDKNEHLTLEF